MPQAAPLPELHGELTEIWRLLSMKISQFLSDPSDLESSQYALDEAKQLRLKIQTSLVEVEAALAAETVNLPAHKTPPFLSVIDPKTVSPVSTHEDIFAVYDADDTPEAAVQNVVIEPEKIEHTPSPPRTIKISKLPGNHCRPDMVLLAGSIFRMGNAQDIGNADERPVIETALMPFSIGRYPVMFEEYDQFIEDVNRALPQAPFKKPKDAWGRGRQPVINVTWHEANIYAEWLSIQTGRKFRLPTEAEWEFAARAGIDDAWWFGDKPDDLTQYAWYRDNANNQTHPVGRKRPNIWGIHEMYGNVWEWTASAYENKLSEQANRCVPRKNKQLPISLRGGSWGDCAKHTRSASRNWLKPNAKNFTVGFRLVEILEDDDARA